MRRFFAIVFAFALLACGEESEKPMAVTRHVFWHTLPTQSNGWGVNPGGPGNQTLSAVPYYDSMIGTSLSTDLHDLTDLHGKDWAIGSQLYALGYNPIIVNVSRGSTYASNWIPGGTYFAAGMAEISNAWSLIQVAYSTDVLVHHHLIDQGEEEIRYPNDIVPRQWANNVSQSCNALNAAIGVPTMDVWVFKTNPNMLGVTQAGILNGLQFDIAGGAKRLINRDGFDWEPNGLHSTTLGYIQSGTQFVAQFVGLYPLPRPETPPVMQRRALSQVRYR